MHPLANPTNSRPVTRWPDRDEAFENVALGIRQLVNELIEQYKVKERKEVLRRREEQERKEAARQKSEQTKMEGVREAIDSRRKNGRK